MKPTLLVLAAGVGSRYGKLKQLDDMGPNGEGLFEYGVYDAIQAGFGKVVFVINKKIEDEFKAFVKGKFEDQIQVVFVNQELDSLTGNIVYTPERSKPWGTGQAILVAKEVIDGPFVMVNADDYYGPEAYQKAADYINSETGYFIVGYPLDNTLSPHGAVNRGILEVDDSHYLTGMIERLKIKKMDDHYVCEENGNTIVLKEQNPLVSMNMIGYPDSIFAELQYRFELFLRTNGLDTTMEFLVPTILNEMMVQQDTKIRILKTDSSWFGVTFPDDKPVVQEKIKALIKEGVYPQKLW